MLAAISVILVVAISLLVTRVATIALTLTGMSRESARFQARSALTGSGFTTNESEAIVNHPVRRRIVMSLMLIGSAGVVTVIGSTALTFATSNSLLDAGSRTLTLLLGLGLLLLVASSKGFDKALQPLIHRLLRRYTDIDTRDYARLLHVAGDYSVMEVVVKQSDWLADHDLAELRLNDEGVLVLGIQRDDGTYLGAPKGWCTLHAGDLLTLYGTSERLAELGDRRAGIIGEQMHAQAADEQREVDGELRAQDVGDSDADDEPHERGA